MASSSLFRIQRLVPRSGYRAKTFRMPAFPARLRSFWRFAFKPDVNVTVAGCKMRVMPFGDLHSVSEPSRGFEDRHAGRHL